MYLLLLILFTIKVHARIHIFIEKLDIDENDLLYRRTTYNRKQLPLLKKLQPLVYLELHVKMRN